MRSFLQTGLALLVAGGATGCTTDTASTSSPDDGTVASVTVSTDQASLAVGSTLALSAVVKTAGGTVLQKAVQWSSSSQGVASVTQQGLVRAIAPGTAEIQAAVDGHLGVARVDVYQPSSASGTINVDVSKRFQTMRGWQSGTNWGLDHPLHATVANEVLDRAVDELGIDRVRMPLRSGVENSRDWYADWVAGRVTSDQWRCNRYATVNDNGDPASLNAGGFHFTELDEHVRETVLPLRQRLRARGEDLYLVLTYLAFIQQNCAGTTFDHKSAEEYAEFLLAAFLHLRDSFGVVPDAIEVLNEPDNAGWGTGSALLGGMVAAASRRLEAAGFHPVFMAPSTASAVNAVSYYDAMLGTPGNASLIAELSYHRYGGSLGDLQAIGARAAAQHVASVMGEKNGAGVQQLYEDLTIANASAWEQGTLAFYLYTGWTDDGTAHYWIDYANAAAPRIFLGVRSRPLRQYFRYVRRGAVRVDATSQDVSYKPTAFINQNGTYVVVVWTSRGGTFTIGGLRAGTYGVNYTTDAELNVERSPVTITGGAVVTATIPQAGVVTVYGK